MLGAELDAPACRSRSSSSVASRIACAAPARAFAVFEAPVVAFAPGASERDEGQRHARAIRRVERADAIFDESRAAFRRAADAAARAWRR